ncbi:MAG TPA: PEGA domain-containing protein [Candidatus Angelobacter sp.]|nr:PEGA domain-containing protein [Candidatus Angelobacter sp.]
MDRRVLLSYPLLILLSHAAAQDQPSRERVPVEVVATAAEYVPTSTTITHPGHAYTNCQGRTSYFGRFSSYGDSGSISGTADTRTNCETSYTPPTETTLTSYRKVNYTIAKGEHGLYLLSCTQTWKPSGTARGLAALHGVLGTGGHQDQAQTQERQERVLAARGAWSECPAFNIGGKYALTVNNTSDARLEDEAKVGDATPKKAAKLEYLSAASLPVPSDQQTSPKQATNISTGATVHITSSPSGGEIYVDGKFSGNTPSDLTLAAGEHSIRVTLAGKDWSRTVQITSGQITIHAEIPAEL